MWFRFVEGEVIVVVVVCEYKIDICFRRIYDIVLITGVFSYV